ncbi:MAG: ribulose-phosphate 3-epimerase [Acidobacteria bacterium]|nr:MAG: ribulose-phosphate 3-epimerase [Acidobacteriota bacterium]
MIRIAPSILSANFAALGEEIRKVEEAGAHMLHVDVMDGHFVPNITIGPPVVRSVRKTTRLPLDVHLMISDPDKYIPAFIEAGSDMLTVHAEATVHLDRTLNFIRSQNAGVGVSINPATPLSAVHHVLGLVDMLLIMSVNPGFGGQPFIPYTVNKIRQARQIIEDHHYRCAIEVDGGIDIDTLPEVVQAGAEVLVAGSAIFHAPDPARKVKELLEIAARLGYHSV